jgi:hypothetical protein
MQSDRARRSTTEEIIYDLGRPKIGIAVRLVIAEQAAVLGLDPDDPIHGRLTNAHNGEFASARFLWDEDAATREAARHAVVDRRRVSFPYNPPATRHGNGCVTLAKLIRRKQIAYGVK